MQPMRVLGLVFAGTATEQRAEMVRFVAETLGLEQVRIARSLGVQLPLPPAWWSARECPLTPSVLARPSRSVDHSACARRSPNRNRHLCLY